MDFKAYAEQKRKEAHKEIIFDICMVVNNCACCYNDETRISTGKLRKRGLI